MTSDSQQLRTAPESYRTLLSERGFDLRERLGSGGAGTVYLAIQRQFSREVAVKFLDNALALRNENNLTRFRRESRLMSLVEHPAIPYVITKGTVKDAAPNQVNYIVMQYVRGERLDEVLARGKVTVGEACRVITTILGALHAAHEHKIVHRDVKPNNIIMGKHTSYLIDFSIGFCEEYQEGLTRTTLHGHRLGVPTYASPEQLADSSTVDRRTDIYSAGVVLLEMLTGGTNVNDSSMRLALSHVPELLDVIAQACSPEREARYSSAADFADALRPFGTGAYPFEGTAALAFCPDLKCRGARWSNGGQGPYYFGPRTLKDSSDVHCTACGGKLMRRCPSCSWALTKEVSTFIGKDLKSDPDPTGAHCPACGTEIFKFPHCAKCNSLLKAEELGADTADGCAKCRNRWSGYSGYAMGQDDDIPF